MTNILSFIPNQPTQHTSRRSAIAVFEKAEYSVRLLHLFPEQFISGTSISGAVYFQNIDFRRGHASVRCFLCIGCFPPHCLAISILGAVFDPTADRNKKTRNDGHRHPMEHLEKKNSTSIQKSRFSSQNSFSRNFRKCFTPVFFLRGQIGTNPATLICSTHIPFHISSGWPLHAVWCEVTHGAFPCHRLVHVYTRVRSIFLGLAWQCLMRSKKKGH